MNISIKHVVYSLTMASLMACSQSFPTLTFEETSGTLEGLNNDEQPVKVPIMLFVNPQEFFSVTATRGMGVFPPEDPADITKGTFYIYAFRSGYNRQGTVLRDMPDLTQTAYANGRAHDTDNANCLLDGNNYLLGAATTLLPKASGELQFKPADDSQYFENETDQEYYYSSTYQEVPYNFFGFYIDDLAVNSSNTHREKTHIWYDLTIDGTQDLMCGMAPELNSIPNNAKTGDTRTVLETRYEKQFKALSDVEKATIRNIGGYSTFAAHRKIQPSIDIRHLMTQLKFIAYPAGESANDIIITGIDVKCQNKLRMTVATQDPEQYPIGIEAYDASSYLKVVTSDPDEMEDRKGYIVPFTDEMVGKEWFERDFVEIGNPIILPPKDNFDIVIHAAQRIKTKEGEPPTVQTFTMEKNIRLTEEGKSFDAGYCYNIRMAIYGRQQIDIYTSIEDWKEGGDVMIDDDED